MNEWPTVSLREAGVTLIDCDHRTPAAMPIGYPYVAIPQLDDGHIDISTARRISREDFEAWTRKALPLQHDVVLSRRTNPGVTAYVPEGLEFALGQNLVLLRSDGQTVYPPFLRWLVRGPNWWAQIEQFLNVGAVFDSLKCADIPSFRLPIPPMKDQRRIAEILGALDDKIELNRRMATTLEGLVRAAYAELQATLSDECSAGSIADVAFNPRDQVDPRQVDPSTPYIGLEHVPRGRMVLGEWGHAVNAESGKLAFQRNDILFGKLRPYFRKVGVVPTSGICSTDILVIRARRPEDLGYVLAVATDAAFIEASNAGSTGTRMPRTSWSDLVRYPLPIPPAPARAAFTQFVWPLIERAQVAVSESETLGHVRDALLPRLLAGDIEVAA